MHCPAPPLGLFAGRLSSSAGGPDTINQGNGRGKWIYLNWRKLPPETKNCRWTVKDRPAMFYKNVNDSIRGQMGKGIEKRPFELIDRPALIVSGLGLWDLFSGELVMEWSFNQKSINNP